MYFCKISNIFSAGHRVVRFGKWMEREGDGRWSTPGQAKWRWAGWMAEKGTGCVEGTKMVKCGWHEQADQWS